MSFKWYRYAFVDSTNKYLYVNANGSVQSSSTEKYLSNSPFDWKGVLVKVQRDMQTFGLQRMFTLPMSFVKDGAKIIRYSVLNYGYDCKLTLIIQKREHTSLVYQDYVRCEVDFTNYYDDSKAFTTKVNLMDNALADLLKSIDNTIFQIDLPSQPESIKINMDGVELLNNVNWLVSNGTSAGNNPALGHVWDSRIVTNDTQSALDVKDQEWYKFSNFNTDVANSDKYFYKASTGRTVTFTFQFGLTVTDGSAGSADFSATGIHVYIAKTDAAGSTTTVHDFILEPNNITYMGHHYVISGTFNATANVGDKYYLVSNVYNTGGGGVPSINVLNWNYDNSSTITLDFYSRTPATTVWGMRFIDVWKKVLSLASNGKYTLLSNYLSNASSTTQAYNKNLDNIPYNSILTSGDAVRGIEDPALKITHQMLRQFARNCWGAAVSVEGDVMRVEQLSTLMDYNKTIITLDEVANFKHSVANELLVNTINIGYDDQQYDLLNGKDEFNIKAQFSLPVGTRPKASADMVSSIRPDMYGMEYARVNGYQKNTTDTNSDDTVFIIEVEPTPTAGLYNIFRRQGVKQGLISPSTAYNFGFSPKRCLLRNMAWVYSLLPGVRGNIIFQSGTKNSSLKTVLGGPIVDEDADINIDTFNLVSKIPLFKPYYFEFEYVSPDDLLTTITNAPYGLVAFKWKGIEYKGFIVDIGLKLGVRDTYTWKLISSPINDLTTLI